MKVNMAKKYIVKIMVILSILFCGTGCGSEDNRPFVEYERFDQILEEINLSVLFPDYFPENLDPQINSTVIQSGKIHYDSARREDQIGYSIILSEFEADDSRKYSTAFNDIYITACLSEVLSKNTYLSPKKVINTSYFNGIIIQSILKDREVSYGERGVEHQLNEKFSYGEFDYCVGTSFYGEYTPEMLSEMGKKLLEVVEQMIQNGDKRRGDY